MNILITGATGMFGGTLCRYFGANHPEHHIKALVRNKDKAIKQGLDQFQNIELAVGDLSDPDSLDTCLQDTDRVFLVSPMVDGLDQLEINCINAAVKNKVDHIFKLYGAVKHDEDHLIQLHNRSIDALKASNLKWALVSPNSVMETCLFGYAEAVKTENMISGCSGHHKVGMVALNDVIAATAALICSDGNEEKEFLLTGPQSISMYEAADALSVATKREIKYQDYSVEEFESLIMEWMGISKKEAYITIICHYEAWNKDGADIVTNTVEELTGKPAQDIYSWCLQHKDKFE